MKQGHESHVITPCPPTPTVIQGTRIYPLKRRLGLAGPRKYLNYLSQITQVRSYIRAIKPDLLNVLFLTDYGFYGAMACFHPFVITPWGTDVLRHPSQKKFWLLSNTYSLHKSDLIFCNSRPMHQALVDKLKVSEKKIKDITWNGVDRAIFNTLNANNLRQNLKLNGKRVLFSNRNLEPLYNIDRILEMFAVFRKKVNESVLMIAGDGSQRDKLARLCEKLKLGSAVVFLGRISPKMMNDYFNLADIYITVPQSDSCSGSLLEAFACEKTVVASDIPANTAWIENRRNGWLVNPENKAKFADVCLNAINQPLPKTEIKNNLEIIEKQADYATNMHRVENELSRLVGSRSAY